MDPSLYNIDYASSFLVGTGSQSVEQPTKNPAPTRKPRKRDEARKARHNFTEKLRRDRLNAKYQRLGDLMTGFVTAETSRLDLIDRSVDYLQYLDLKHKSKSEHIDRIREQEQLALDMLNDLRSQLGMEKLSSEPINSYEGNDNDNDAYIPPRPVARKSQGLTIDTSSADESIMTQLSSTSTDFRISASPTLDLNLAASYSVASPATSAFGDFVVPSQPSPLTPITPMSAVFPKSRHSTLFQDITHTMPTMPGTPTSYLPNTPYSPLPSYAMHNSATIPSPMSPEQMYFFLMSQSVSHC
ncbi:hypothetical protein BKA69DRAFT_1070988 [Paraphysoderma sedebokerense]|nr:hypothetical protein BKA69DRAFT_1070988 [Paraphysoderma sedebokerense]